MTAKITMAVLDSAEIKKKIKKKKGKEHKKTSMVCSV